MIRMLACLLGFHRFPAVTELEIPEGHPAANDGFTALHVRICPDCGRTTGEAGL